MPAVGALMVLRADDRHQGVAQHLSATSKCWANTAAMRRLAA